MPAPPADSDLSPRLAELAKPALRTRSAAEQAAALDLASSGPGSLLRDGNRVLVDVRFDGGAAAGARCAARGRGRDRPRSAAATGR